MSQHCNKEIWEILNDNLESVGLKYYPNDNDFNKSYLNSHQVQKLHYNLERYIAANLEEFISDPNNDKYIADIVIHAFCEAEFIKSAIMNDYNSLNIRLSFKWLTNTITDIFYSASNETVKSIFNKLSEISNEDKMMMTGVLMTSMIHSISIAEDTSKIFSFIPDKISEEKIQEFKKLLFKDQFINNDKREIINFIIDVNFKNNEGGLI